MMPWNTGRHARKFLASRGLAQSDDGSEAQDELVFWGEWESESNYRRLGRDRPAGMPSVVHEPFWVDPDDRSFRQNTDPYVFGDCFRYSNCKQLYRGKA